MKKLKMGKYVIIVGLFTVAAQGSIYALVNRVDTLAVVVITSLFILQGLIVHILTDKDSFDKGLMASKDHNSIQKIIATQVSKSLTMIDKERREALKQAPAGPLAPSQDDYSDLEITGI